MNIPLRRLIASVLCVLVPFLFMVGLPGSPVYACTPPPPTPWFETETHLIATNLPANVKVADTTDGTVVLENNGNVPLDVVLSGQEQASGGRYTVKPGDAATFATGGGYYGELLSVDFYEITQLEHRNVIEDNRPANPPLPEPQVAWVQVLMAQQSYYVQLRITYRLSEHYRADSVYAAQNVRCPETSYDGFLFILPMLYSPFGGFLLGLVVTTVISVLIFWPILRDRFPSESSEPGKRPED